MTRVIAIANQKGGCAKTTTAVNLAAGFARAMPDKPILLVDVDPQANATAVYMGVNFAAGPREADQHTIYEVIINDLPVEQALYTIDLDPVGGVQAQLDILPAHLDLASAELELVNLFERERRLPNALQPILSHYAVVIIDCPPSLGLLTVNGLMSANEILIPVDPGLFPVIGLNLLHNTINMVKRANRALHIMGVIPTLQDRTALSRDTEEELKGAFSDLVLPSIPRRVAIGEAHASGRDVFAYDSQSDGAQAYAELLREIMRRG